MICWRTVGGSRKTTGARMVANVFSENWIAINGPVVRMQVRRARILRLLLLLRVSEMWIGKRNGRVLDSTTCLVVGGWYGT